VSNNGDVAQSHAEPRLSKHYVAMREFALDVRQRRANVNGDRRFCAGCDTQSCEGGGPHHRFCPTLG
jgi:hypothetical protein